MRINTNITAMNTFASYSKNNNKIADSVAKLSSGYAINSAADNAAGLAISEKMRAQIRGLDQASSNSQDAISLVQTAEGSLGESTEILQRMRELSVQSSNDTNNNSVDREALQDEFSQLQEELDDISSTTSFNKKSLLDGSLATSTAKLSNVDLAKSGLSVELGNVASGSYNFSVGVKQESAAITGVKSTFTADSSSDSFTVGAVTNNIAASSLANGNYTITAAYDTANDKMVFTAKGDNNQTFEATLNSTQLAASFGSTPGTDATLNFSNGESTAFSFTVDATATYTTTSDDTMESLASSLTDALSLSASKGVDAQDATYGLYASMTGAEDVKLSANMDSVTFSNGAKVNFDKLTTTDVKTANTAVMTDLDVGAAHNFDATAFTNLKVNDDCDIANGLATGTMTMAATSATRLTASVGTTDYTCDISASALAAMQATATTDTTTTLTFNDADGNAAFTLDLTLASTDGTNPTAMVVADLATSTGGAITGAGYNSETIFGTEASTFDVTNKAGEGLTFQVGANTGDELTINIDKMDANYLGVASLDISSQDGATAAIDAVDDAINQVSSQRAYLGAIQNRLTHKIANLDTSSENLTAAESQIRDVDMAEEMTKFTNANILSQAATAMLAQANSLPQNVLSLIG